MCGLRKKHDRVRKRSGFGFAATVSFLFRGLRLFLFLAERLKD